MSKSASFQRVFSDDKDSEIVLDYLETQTAGFDVDPYQHAFNAGKRRIVEIIKDMRDKKEYDKHIKHLKELENAGRPDSTDN